MKRPPQISTLFPYPPLFRSLGPVPACPAEPAAVKGACAPQAVLPLTGRTDAARGNQVRRVGRRGACDTQQGPRSEEHTSELQSRQYLVCRLLLEKKKHKM